MLSYIEYIITYTVEAIMLFHIGRAVFRPTKPTKLRIAYLVLTHGAMTLICPFHIIWLNSGLYTCVATLYFGIFHEREIRKSIFFGVLAICTESIAELLAVGMIAMLDSDYEVLQSMSGSVHYQAIEMAILTCVIYSFMCWGIVRLQKKTRITDGDGRSWLFFFMLLLTSVVAVEVVASCVAFKWDLNKGLLIVLITAFIVLIEIIMMIGLRNAVERAYKENALSQQLLRESEQAEYYRTLSEQYERRSVLVHDIRNHLMAIRELNRTGKGKEIDQYIDGLILDTELTPAVSVSDNDFVNALVLRYMKLAEQRGVKLSADVRAGALSGVPERAIVSVLGNLMDNALEAAVGAIDAFIELKASRGEGSDYVVVMVQNSCAKPPRMDGDGHFISSKQRREHHGYGLRSVQRVVDEYDGEWNIEYRAEEKMFVVELILRVPIED